MEVPPQTTFIFRPRTSPYGWSASATCMASSRVGVRMTARGLCFSVRPPASVARVGRPNDRVLPEPVRPRPRMSLPARASGMVAAWIGNGAVTPFCASLRTMPSGSPRSAKVSWGASVSTALSAPSGSSGRTTWSVLATDMRMESLPELYGSTRPNSVKSQSTASMRSGHGKGEYAPHAARLFLAPGKWDQTIYHHTHRAPQDANPRVRDVRTPTRMAGNARRTPDRTHG